MGGVVATARPSCFPFNRAGENTGTSTNAANCKGRPKAPLQCRKVVGEAGGPMSRMDELAERVERLLLRHEELKRTNTLLQQELEAVKAERDSLRARLGAARTRIDALLERLPADPPVEDRA